MHRYANSGPIVIKVCDLTNHEKSYELQSNTNMREITRGTTLLQRFVEEKNFPLSLSTGDEFTENGNPGLGVINYLQPNVAGKVRPSNKKCLSHKLPVSRKQLLKFLIRI